jgi:hypothetical protein
VIGRGNACGQALRFLSWRFAWKLHNGASLTLRLDHGDDILRSIGRSIVAGLGMISEFELGYWVD